MSRLNKEELISEDASNEDIVRRIADLALSQDESAISELQKFLRINIHFSTAREEAALAVSRLATRALLQKGTVGVQVLNNAVFEASFEDRPRFDVGTIIEGLWHVARAQLPPKGMLLEVDLVPPLDNPPSVDTVEAAKQSFHELLQRVN